MKPLDTLKVVVLYLLFSSLMTVSVTARENFSLVFNLNKGWTLEPFGTWSDDGKLIASEGYQPKNRLSCDVPTTVFAALVKSGKFKDPFFADNLEKVPVEWFKKQWKFTRMFDLSIDHVTAYARLCLDGINYSADIYLNGQKIASADTLKGAFRRFEVNVTGKLLKGKNELNVVVFPPKPGDFTIGFVDWTPHPPDKNMGIWRGVSLRFNGKISVNHTVVTSKLKFGPEKNEAALTIQSEVINHTGNPQIATINARIGNVMVEQNVSLKPHEQKLVTWTPQNFPALIISDPRLWWPYTMGEPNLYTLKIECIVNKVLSDSASQRFGIREVSDYINSKGSRAYKVNGRELQIRGGGWTDDLLLREDADNVEAQVNYTKLMNLNCIRLEGFWGSSSKLYDYCDQQGVLVMTGWSCQWEWEEYLGKKCDDFGGIETPEDMDLVSRSLIDHVLWLRNHPSIFVWVLGSDKLPRPALEKRYMNDLAIIDPTRPLLMSCAMKISEISGSTAVKMNGPYDYVSPNYWYLDTKNGGAFGFNTETGPGPQIPPIESLRKMFPENKLWPINDLWNFHSGRNQFNTITNYLMALNKRYGEAKNIDDFEMKAQLANYEAIRPMFESFALNKAEAGGIVQWMLNASWPKLYWQLYDFYLMPNSAFFGTQTALKPFNLIYHYGTKSIYVSNDNQKAVDHVTAQIKVLDIQSKLIYSNTIPFDVKSNTSKLLADLPEFKDISTAYFLDLRIKNKEGMELSHNFYWLSTKNDVNDFDQSSWFITPLKEFADFTMLSAMPKSEIQIKPLWEAQGNETVGTVHIKNSSDKLAFFLAMNVTGQSSKRVILPVFWSENYISLLPGEEREVTVKMNNRDLNGEQPIITVKGVNTTKN